jgi:hypothetical protein
MTTSNLAVGKVLGNPPIKPPWIARHVWSLAAWCSPLTFVFYYPVYKAYAWLFLQIHTRIPLFHDPPLVIVFFTSFSLCVFPPILWGASSGSKYLLALVHYYLESGNKETAIQLADVLAAKLWFRDFKKDEGFRRFVIESGLADRNERYKGMLNRLKR